MSKYRSLEHLIKDVWKDQRINEAWEGVGRKDTPSSIDLDTLKEQLKIHLNRVNHPNPKIAKAHAAIVNNLKSLMELYKE